MSDTSYVATIWDAETDVHVGTVCAYWIGECRTLAEKTAERFMLKEIITKGAYIRINQVGSEVIVYESYYWPQITSADVM